MEIEYIAIWIPFVAIVAVAKVVLTAMRNHQEIKLAQLQAKTGRGERDAETTRRQDERSEMLEERVRVLERIVTDRGHDVAAQIEALRDTQRVDQLLENRSEKEAN